MNNKKLIGIIGIVFFCFISISAAAAAANISTLPATKIGKCDVTLNGELLNIKYNDKTVVWFEWGLSTGGFVFRTDNQILTEVGTFSKYVKSYALFCDTKYKYRAVVMYGGSGVMCDGEIEYGETKTFTMETIDIEEYDFNIWEKTIEIIICVVFFGILLILISIKLFLKK